jgi:hypothetical protein
MEVMEFSQFQLSASGTATGFTWYSYASGDTEQAAVYSDNADKVGNLLGVSNTLVTVAGNSNTASLPPIYLVPGKYWLAVRYPPNAYAGDDCQAANNGLYLSLAKAPGTVFPSTVTQTPTVGCALFMTLQYCPGPPLFSTPTVTPMPTSTPILYLSAGAVGKAVVGPVPVHRGSPVCLYLPKAAISSTWDVYNPAGQRVANLSYDNGAQACWDTVKVAPGLYYVKAKVSYADGSSGDVLQKVVVIQ